MILSQEHQMLRDAVRQYAREQLAPNAAAWDRDGTFPAEALKGLAVMGLYGIAIAEEWGGAGMDYTALALAIEEIAAGDGSTSTIIQVNNLAAGILAGYGTPAQKERYLRPLARGDMLGAFALTEPHAGSDAGATMAPEWVWADASRCRHRHARNGLAPQVWSHRRGRCRLHSARWSHPAPRRAGRQSRHRET